MRIAADHQTCCPVNIGVAFPHLAATSLNLVTGHRERLGHPSKRHRITRSLGAFYHIPFIILAGWAILGNAS